MICHLFLFRLRLWPCRNYPWPN